MSRVSELLGIAAPLVLGPFGGGLSRPALVAQVSQAGGLGSYGAHHLPPEPLAAVVRDLRERTSRPFAVNLWVSTHDVPEVEMTTERYAAAADRLRPLYAEYGVEAPVRPPRFAHDFDRQVAALIEAGLPAISFTFGVPGADVLDACRERGIRIIATAATRAEAVALDDAGVDIIGAPRVPHRHRRALRRPGRADPAPSQRRGSPPGTRPRRGAIPPISRRVIEVAGLGRSPMPRAAGRCARRKRVQR